MTKSFFKDINCWDDFVNKQTSLNNTDKGAAFELLTKLYFKTNPLYHDYDDVWLLKEVPQKELDNLKISRQDLGIDLIAKKGKEYHAIQCKYHGDKNKNVTFKEVATFLQMVESNKKIEMGYICSSANGTSRNYQKIQKKNIQEILSDSWQLLNKENFNNFRKVLNKKAVTYKPFKPRKHQKKAIKEAKNHFIKENNSRGKLIFPCGAGKSLTGFWLAEALESKATLIAVPSLSLVKQTLEVYLREIVANKIKVEWLCICSDEGIGTSDDVAVMTNNIGVACKTDPKYIRDWLKANKDEHKIIFTTYQSGHLIADISKKLKMSFDVGIFDEAHKTVGSSLKQFSYLLFEKNIKIDKRIFMTATERFYSGSKEDIISMDDEDVYGATFTQMSFKEAIDLNLLTDYKVITIDIKKSEIAEFIKDNNLVQLNDKWKKETEARSLASMLAMRKAMNKFKIKNVVSFHSSIEKARRNKELQEYITNTYNYKPIDTYTVSGKIPTSKRNDIVQEFAKSNRALITNARCLTEGIDVPNIDCIVFADPRKSRVDIVQALGRALRKKEGKEWGYVILPVVYDGDTNEIDNDNFNEIINIVRGLAANDERIVEYFKDKSIKGNSKRDMVGGSEVFSFDSSMLKEKDLAGQLQIKIWEKLSKFKWMSFEEAREVARSLGLKSVKEWRNYNKMHPNNNLPSKPYNTYRNKWIDWGDFLGYNMFSNWTKYDNIYSYEEAKLFLKNKCKGKINSISMYSKWYNGELKDKLLPPFPERLPKHPTIYKKNKNWNVYDFFGKERKELKRHNYVHFKYEKISYKKLKEIVQKCNLNSRKEYEEWLDKNESIFYKKGLYAPKKAESYKNEFEGWTVFLNSKSKYSLGKKSKYSQHRKYKSYLATKKYLKKYSIDSNTKFNKFKKNQLDGVPNFPNDIPRTPEQFYKNQWVSWHSFFGRKTKLNSKNKNVDLNEKEYYYSFEKCKEVIQKFDLHTVSDFKIFIKSNNKPKRIPYHPHRIYQAEWKGWRDFLGTVKLSYVAAKKYLIPLKLKGQDDFNLYFKKNKNKVIPISPSYFYKDKGWKGWRDFLGNDYLNFEESKKIIKSYKILSKDEFNVFKNTDKFPKGVPKKPEAMYFNKGWKGWKDFLGN